MTNVSTLTSLAMLKVRHDHDGSDYLDYVVPFVSHALAQHRSSTAFELQTDLEQKFGLRFPQRVIELVLSRLVRRKHASRNHKSYSPKGELHLHDFESRRSQARRRLQVVTNALVSFASGYGTVWSETEAIEAIIAYLSRYSIECLQAYSQGTALPTIPPAPSSDLFLVNLFIRDAHEHSTQLFEDIILLVESQMLMNGLLCPDLQWTKQKFAGVTFFLDTPLVMPLLGLEGEEKKAAVLELLELVRNLKGTIAIFEHTAEEIESILDRCERHFGDPNARARVICELRRIGKEASDIALLRAGLPDLYNELRIEVRESPRRLKTVQIDERELEVAIREEIRYWNEHALRYDVDSIRSVYTLRGGRTPSRLENCTAVLVTSNVSLARVASKFGRDHESLREVSAVITDMTLSNIAWLKAPMGAPDLPKMEVLAACHAAMQPRDRLLDKFVKEINRLRLNGKITPQQHEYLRLSPRVRDELMKLTFGDEERLTKQTLSDVLSATEDSILGHERQAFAVERRQTSQRLTEVSVLLETATNEIATIRDRAANRDAAIKKQLYWFSQRCGRLAGLTTFLILSVILLGACIATAAHFDNRGGKLGFYASILAMILLLWDHFARVWGWTALDVSRRVENRIAEWAFSATQVFLLPDDLKMSYEEATTVKQELEGKTNAVSQNVA